ncbi:hypothetical protein P171DRAFT_287254 [Karstenula rhodostoma CBS 690.94]|uniref:Uncharacterized protein n=1 Tax=Karstenula rhodostoma CBS 690.94 TaxID=1392251 RepID=A0A9P4PH64_9PLEO|nr:hypothetical protein P171DRAFT_287254 [Karstenula rhodostoma CBS 690.94]
MLRRVVVCAAKRNADKQVMCGSTFAESWKRWFAESRTGEWIERRHLDSAICVLTHVRSILLVMGVMIMMGAMDGRQDKFGIKVQRIVQSVEPEKINEHQSGGVASFSSVDKT